MAEQRNVRLCQMKYSATVDTARFRGFGLSGFPKFWHAPLQAGLHPIRSFAVASHASEGLKMGSAQVCKSGRQIWRSMILLRSKTSPGRRLVMGAEQIQGFSVWRSTPRRVAPKEGIYRVH